MKTNDLPLRRWIRAFVQWLRRGRKQGTKIKILGESYTDRSALYRYVDPSVPGCVECWKCVYRGASGDLLLTLVELALLREETAGRNFSSLLPPRHQPWQSSYARGLEASLEAQSNVAATHYWIVSWLKVKRRIDSKGRNYSAPVAELVGVWACDFQGALGPIAGNRYACHLAAHFAKKIAGWEPSELNSWEEFVNVIPWQKWLEAYSKQALGELHVLQPLKKRRPQKQTKQNPDK